MREVAEERMVFCDRGRWDVEAYRLFHRVSPPVLTGDEECPNYLAAFVLDTLPEFSSRRETGRQSTRSSSVQMRDLLLKVYQERGVQTHLVPVAPLEVRLEQVLRTLGVVPV